MADLLVIVGPTASGKSDLAMKLAKLLNGEIICADSRTVYKGIDIGTAKPSKIDQQAVRHHLLDVVKPDKNFTVADFKRMADEAINDIQKRGKLPIMVGGSGLYIDAVLYNYQFADKDTERDPVNPRHLSQDAPRIKADLMAGTIIVGLDVDRDTLKYRITQRVDKMLANGFLEEVKQLQAEYPSSKALLAPGYKAFTEYLYGRLSLDEAKALFVRNDYQLARRQMTWFRRNHEIHWLNNKNTYLEQTLKLLNKLQ